MISTRRAYHGIDVSLGNYTNTEEQLYCINKATKLNPLNWYVMYLDKAIEIKRRMTEELIKNSGSKTIFESSGFLNATGRINEPNHIVGVGVSVRQKDDYLIKIYLSSERSRINIGATSSYFSIPPNEIAVNYTGKISAQKKFRPLIPGCSVAHYHVTAGTLGCVVRDAFNQNYILSNNHVLANSNNSFYGDIILQPGHLDGGIYPQDKAAVLHTFIPIDFNAYNEIDAALAFPTEHFLTDLPHIGNIKGTTIPRLGMRVKKIGRTTGYTEGQITAISADIKVDFNGASAEFEDQFEIEGFTHLFSGGGDSGSLIVEHHTNNAVGLLFAGSQMGTTFANPINKVLDAFQVKIA